MPRTRYSCCALGGGLAHGLNLGLRLAQLVQQRQGGRGLGLVDAAHGEADMDQHPFTDIGVGRAAVGGDEADVDRASHAADVHDRHFAVGAVDLDDAARNA